MSKIAHLLQTIAFAAFFVFTAFNTVRAMIQGVDTFLIILLGVLAGVSGALTWKSFIDAKQGN